MTCKGAMAALVASIETNDALSQDAREHLKHCAHCRALLDSARRVESALISEPVQNSAVDESRLHDRLRSGSRAHFVRRGVTVVLVSIGISAAIATLVTMSGYSNWREGMLIFSAVSLLTTIPALLFYALIAALHDPHGNRIHKRLKEGRLLSGVCLGLAEATGVSVQLLRIAFVLLAFAKGIGIWLYIILDLAMPVHPDDRVNLLRFRIRRWFQRTFAHGDANAR